MMEAVHCNQPTIPWLADCSSLPPKKQCTIKGSLLVPALWHTGDSAVAVARSALLSGNLLLSLRFCHQGYFVHKLTGQGKVTGGEAVGPAEWVILSTKFLNSSSIEDILWQTQRYKVLYVVCSFREFSHILLPQASFSPIFQVFGRPAKPLSTMHKSV